MQSDKGMWANWCSRPCSSSSSRTGLRAGAVVHCHCRHVDIHAAGGYSALIFRVAMPTAVDIASLIYISVMKFKSLKSHIENLRQEAIALRELNDADIAIRKSQNALKQQEAREDLLMKVEAIQAKAVLRAVEKSLLEQPEKRSGWQMRQSGN